MASFDENMKRIKELLGEMEFPSRAGQTDVATPARPDVGYEPPGFQVFSGDEHISGYTVGKDRTDFGMAETTVDPATGVRHIPATRDQIRELTMGNFRFFQHPSGTVYPTLQAAEYGGPGFIKNLDKYMGIGAYKGKAAMLATPALGGMAGAAALITGETAKARELTKGQMDVLREAVEMLKEPEIPPGVAGPGDLFGTDLPPGVAPGEKEESLQDWEEKSYLMSPDYWKDVYPYTKRRKRKPYFLHEELDF